MIDPQEMVIEAVREANGASDQFVLGCLLIKLPDCGTMLVGFESGFVPARGSSVMIYATPKQLAFLDSYRGAGMACGVLSLLYEKKERKNCFRGLLFDSDHCAAPMRATLSQYHDLGSTNEFNANVVELLRSFAKI